MRFGYANVDALGRSLTAKQFAAWEHYAQLEPFDEMRADYRAASIREMIHNLAVKPEDRQPLEYFMLDFEGDKKKKAPSKQPVEQQIMFLNILAATLQ